MTDEQREPRRLETISQTCTYYDVSTVDHSCNLPASSTLPTLQAQPCRLVGIPFLFSTSAAPNMHAGNEFYMESVSLNVVSLSLSPSPLILGSLCSPPISTRFQILYPSPVQVVDIKTISNSWLDVIRTSPSFRSAPWPPLRMNQTNDTARTQATFVSSLKLIRCHTSLPALCSLFRRTYD